MTGQPYKCQWWCIYFVVKVSASTWARFKRNRFTRTLYVFQANCVKHDNRWNEPGHGWGQWRRIR